MNMRRYASVFLALVLLTQAFPQAAMCETDQGLSDSANPIWASMGGALVTQPLGHAIYCHWTGVDEQSASRVIQFDRSDWPYQDLSSSATQVGVPDWDVFPLYFALEPYGEEQTRKELEETYEFVPIARDALVFLTNTQNPVTDVSRQDMVKIYSGQLENWRELGGKDAAIQAFQRPEFAYSQKMLKDILMLDKPMVEPIVQWIHMNEGGIEPIPVNAAYDNSECALGYTMYYYTQDMFDSENTRMLMIDGVMPSRQTIQAGQYPLITTCYAIYPKETPKDHPIRTLVPWLLTKEGQQVVESAGFVPLMQLAKAYQADTPPYSRESTRQSCGTGGTQDRNQEQQFYSDDCIRGIGEMRWLWNSTGWDEVLLDLPDAAMMATIEGWRQSAKEELKLAAKGKALDMAEYVYFYGNLVSFFESVGWGSDAQVRTAVFDLKTGARLQLSDLFLDGFNYIRYLNRFLLESSFQQGSGALGDFSIEEQNLKRPFSGLPADYPYFVVTQQGEISLVFSGDNPLIQVPYDNLYTTNIPLWHGISPWGGCKIEQSFHEIERQNPKSVFYQLTLQIDDGWQLEAQRALQAMQSTCLKAFTEVVDNPSMLYQPDEVVICQPFLQVYGRWLSVVFFAYEAEEASYSPMIGGTVIDLHTGKPLLTDAQAKDLAMNTAAVIQRKDGAVSPRVDMEPIAGYIPSDKATVRSVWLDYSSREKGATDVFVDITEADGSYIRVSVPLKAIALQ